MTLFSNGGRLRAVGAVLCALAIPPLALAGAGGERAILVVDPASAESMYVANVYAARRDLPASNFVYMAPGATSYPEFAATNLPAFFGELALRGLGDHIDFVIIPPGGDFHVPAPGLVSDMCAPVQRFSSASCYTLAYQSERILAGNLQMSATNQYAKNNYSARAFSSAFSWFGGLPSEEPGARRYFIGAMLGYTGERGNSLQEILDLIERSASVDGTFPAGTFYYMQTTDANRSGPRHDAYPNAVMRITDAGGVAEHLFANLPIGRHDCLGIMTGLASPDIDAGDFSLVPGAFADHLTSFAGRFDTSAQVKMSRWIAKGASGASGTVEEPCNYPGKFPHARTHGTYFKGLSMGEAWLRGLPFTPFQQLLYGDPLTRPWSYLPTVDVPGLPLSPVSGTITIAPVASATKPLASIDTLVLLVDGVTLAEVPAGSDFQLDTGELCDGWHELRVIAHDGELERNRASWVGSIEVDNAGLAITLAVLPAAGDLSQQFDFTFSASGAVVAEVQLMHNGRIVAAGVQSDDTLALFGQNLGAGPIDVVAVARFVDGRTARSAPVSLDITYFAGTPGTDAPVAFAYTKTVLDDSSFIVELPAASDLDPASATYALLSLPAQATLISSGTAPYAIFTPAPGASGTDSLSYQVTTASGTSGSATVTLVYTPECPLPESYCSSIPNSSGDSALIGASGTASAAANDLVLTAIQVPPGVPGVFFFGVSQISVAFGDGLRCVGGMTFRINPPVFADGGGNVARSVDVGATPFAGQLLPGSSWNFQFWFRDAAAGGAGFNLTDGLHIDFCD
ncbi:MAG: hypothetical protein ACI8QZ_001151 [Chlamydiales bacterium]|jgi:hypothetical protein